MAILTNEKRISNFIRKTIIESIQDVFTDPDYGLEMEKNFAKRLKKYSIKNPKKLISLSDIKKKYG